MSILPSAVGGGGRAERMRGELDEGKEASQIPEGLKPVFVLG